MDSVSETDKAQQDQVKAADVEIELASMKGNRSTLSYSPNALLMHRSCKPLTPSHRAAAAGPAHVQTPVHAELRESRVPDVGLASLYEALRCPVARADSIEHRPIKRLIVHTHRLVNATVKLLFNTYTTEYRLVIVDSCKSVCVSMECKPLPSLPLAPMATSSSIYTVAGKKH